MLVEVLPKPEIKSAGGLIVSSGNDIRSSTKENQADLALVLAVGAGYVDEDGNTVDVDLQPGSVILVSRMGLRLYSQFPGLSEYTAESIALTRETEVHCAWPSIEDYLAYQTKLNS
jgi:co-chaperonin GroES (HSP10)